jgi:hypothetical protein
MRQGVRQQLVGLVVNQRMNVRRNDFDRLKAILTNCVRLGSGSQNHEAHPNFRAQSGRPDRVCRIGQFRQGQATTQTVGEDPMAIIHS